MWRFNPEERAEKRYQSIGVCVGHTEPVSAVGFPRRGNSFVITGSHDRTVKLWDLPDGGGLMLFLVFLEVGHMLIFGCREDTSG